uniref:mitochondrial import receptor subunit TOM6 homolog n=1 Tax=Jaculus jaculus TaxID=51337 RepID=UPI001E1B37C3|nr:mitochondrial import receptor subunit TOM6 homolog [Jaculus jaculus]
MASSGVTVRTEGPTNEFLEVSDDVGDLLHRVYPFDINRNDFQRNLILYLIPFATGVWLARNVSDIDLVAPHPGFSQTDGISVLDPNFLKTAYNL